MISLAVRIGRIYLLEDFGILEVLSSLNEILLVVPGIFLAVGVLYCFYGKKLFDFLNFLIGGFIAVGFMAFVHAETEFILFLSTVASFLVGGLIGFFVPYFLVGAAGFSLGLGLFFGISPLLGLVFGTAGAVAGIVLLRFFLPAMTSLIGAGIAGSAVFELTGSSTISLLVGFVLFAAGTAFQYFYLVSKDEDGQKPDQA